MRQFLLLILILNLISISAFAATPKNHKFYEKDYQNYWCRANGGVTEVILPDKARVDCVTKTHAVENGQKVSDNLCIMENNYIKKLELC